MEEEHHSHHVTTKSNTASPAKEVSSPRAAHDKHEERRDETRESSAREHKEHHLAHLHNSPQSKMTIGPASMVSPSMNYNVNVQFDPAAPQAGKPTNLKLIITEQRVGEPIKDFDIVHDKLLHLIMVNTKDLSHFAHVHPMLDKETGVFHITHTFQRPGKYKMWIDAKPKGGIQTLTAFTFNVEGPAVHTPATIAHEQTRVKNVDAEGQSYQVSLHCLPEQLVSGRDTKMTFEIRDANGKPISNLEPLMAAGGHCVIIDADGLEFLHVHPLEEIDDIVSWRGGPYVSFLANFPKPGLYRA